MWLVDRAGTVLHDLIIVLGVKERPQSNVFLWGLALVCQLFSLSLWEYRRKKMQLWYIAAIFLCDVAGKEIHFIFVFLG